jgi:hypothetical protein
MEDQYFALKLQRRTTGALKIERIWSARAASVEK